MNQLWHGMAFINQTNPLARVITNRGDDRCVLLPSSVPTFLEHSITVFHLFLCVGVCVCACERARERERERESERLIFTDM